MKRSTPLKRTGGLKRTEFKRTSGIKRGKPVKWKASKRKSWKDPALLSEFHETYSEDQVERWLRGPQWRQIRLSYSNRVTLMAHHIFHSAKRADKWSNLILMSSRAHVYAHADPIGSTVACMMAVVRRDGDLSEIRKAWAEGCIKEPLGWLFGEMKDETVPDWYMPMANELLRIFSV